MGIEKRLGVFYCHNTTARSGNTVGSGMLCSPQTFCIAGDEGFSGCLPEAEYARCLGRDANG